MLCPTCRNETLPEAAYCGVCYEVLRKAPTGKPVPAMPLPGKSPPPSRALAAWSAAAACAAGVVSIAGPHARGAGFVLLGALGRLRSASPWTGGRLAVATGLFLLLTAAREWIISVSWFLDWANLAFHEGGHIIFGLLGSRFLMVLGGTLMQLLPPAAAMFHFRRRSMKFSADMAFLWFGQNLVGIGRYIADARAQNLELIAGGVHDWTYLLETAGLLAWDGWLGCSCQASGCLVMALALAGGYGHWGDPDSVPLSRDFKIGS